MPSFLESLIGIISIIPWVFPTGITILLGILS
jgi:hypothetical protein